MTSDLVDRLRAPAYWFSGSDEGHEGENNAPYEAAVEIERLRAALREFCDRVDRGEVKSVRTYAKFKALLEERT